MDALASMSSFRSLRRAWPMVRPRVATGLVLLIALIATVQLGRDYSSTWRQLWTDPVHDRNAHLEGGLALSHDVAQGRVGDALRAVDRARTWPPLHDLVMVGVSAGFGAKWAVLPSLVGYGVSIVFAFLLTRRLAGTVAGGVAALFVLVSPAMRGFATDVMLESAGAAATLVALDCAVRVRQGDAPRAWTGLALALSALFFVKYNYWLLVAIPLTPMILRRAGLDAPRSLLLRQPRRLQLGWSLLTLVLVMLAIGLRWTRVSPTLAITAAWWSLCLQVMVALRADRAVLDDPRWGPLVRWHVVPIAAWLAWPGKLSSFLWFLWPGSNVGEFPATSRIEGFPFYARAIAVDYHVAVPLALGVAGLLLLGLIGSGRLRPGIGLIAGFVVLAVLLTAPHPNRKSRFVHAWLPAVWVLAGCGVGVMARSRWQPLGLATASLLIAVQAPSLSARPRCPEGGLRLDRPSALTITDAYLPWLNADRRPVVLCNITMKFMVWWTYRDCYPAGRRPITDVPGFDSARPGEPNRAVFLRWLESLPSDEIVLIDLPATSPWYVAVPGCDGMQQLVWLMHEQTHFARVDHRELGEPGDGAVSLWRRVRR